MRVCVLIVGSLLWDDDGRRLGWREQHLELNEDAAVTSPIRYGRRSITRANTFTMTMDRRRGLGTARLVSLQREADDINALIHEATALWNAEDRKAKEGAISATWGAVGALFSPEQPPAARNDWTNWYPTQSPPAPINSSGLLEIDWPLHVANGEPVDADVILATATKSSGVDISPAEVARAWIRQDDGHEAYFFNNVSRGIRTPDDQQIWSTIESTAPRWIGNARYRAAIETLKMK